MSRAIAILAALAVLWHTTAGCCAHHGHASSVGHALAVTHLCDHAHDDGAESDQPSHAPSKRCSEVTCVFAIPDAPMSIEYGTSVGIVRGDGIVDDPSGSASSASVGSATGIAPFPFAALARHLALGVLLL